ncbi:MAG TPA: AAA family ATPase [bacterium]|nr:AAA family ATPase [bacterium]HPQ66672.1 AAA family ATPase [bacterium]
MTIHLRRVALQHAKFPTRDRYPFNLPVLTETDAVSFSTPVTLFVGENGTGKSTLLEAIARACGIHIWSQAAGARCRVNPYEALLDRCLGLDWSDGEVPGSYFGSETFRDFADSLEGWAVADRRHLDYFGGKSLVTQSHGQSMMSYFRARYKIRGLYLLDEPETALSPRSQLELLDILEKEGRAGQAQFIVATHSPLLLACAGARIYSFDHVPVRHVGYKETEHYRVYKRFLAERE